MECLDPLETTILPDRTIKGFVNARYKQGRQRRKSSPTAMPVK